MNYWWVAVAAGVLSFALTHVLRRYALHKSLLDIPNGRSSHTIPTPRGGGVAIVISYLVALVWMLCAGLIGRDPFLAMFGAGALIAALGFLDDHGHIAARWRLLGHFFAAAWALFWLGGLPPISVFGMALAPGLIVNVLAAFYLVWLLNLLLACAVAGFLAWNFPPAKIFMGDAGSGFLGIMLGCLSLQGAWISSQFLWVWLILLGVFIVDATVTLIRRLIRGDKVYEAHRSHAYQFASRRFGKHLPVTSAVGVINLCWLLPVAVGVTRFGLDGALGVIIAYAPLLALAVIFKAGALEKS
ncbi:glycosyl transferase [Pseudomonas sp. NZIPFR-PS5]|nr:glycosyl transferase [Pseudomonas sp. NZIPFR-PS5]